MARIRSVKPTFATSEAIAALSVPARLHFILLWTYADDEGRGLDNARLLKGALWPLDDDITAGDVEDYQDELERAGRLVRYEVDGRSYFEICNFQEHQKPNRPQGSKLPPPPFTEHSVSTPAQDTPVVVEGEVVVEGKVVVADSARDENLIETPKTDSEYSEAFEEAWKIYPRRVAKKQAWKAWSATLKRKFTTEQLIEGARNYAEECKRLKREEQYIKHAATFWGPNEHFMDYQTPRTPSMGASSMDRDRTGGVQEVPLSEIFDDWDSDELF